MTLAEEMVAAYITAEKQLLSGKEVWFSGRRITFEDLQEIRAGRIEWEKRVAAEAASTFPSINGLTYMLGDFNHDK